MGSGSTTGVIPSNGAWGYSTQTPETFDSSTLTPNLSSVVPGGTYVSQGAQVLTPKDAAFAAKGDLRRTTDVVGTANSNVITSASNQFVNAKVGQLLFFGGAGAVGVDAISPSQAGWLSTSITAVAPGGGSVTLADNVVTSVAANGLCYFGTDDTVALQAWATALSAVVSPWATTAPIAASAGDLSTGQYLVMGEIVFGTAAHRSDGLTIRGGGRTACRIWDGRMSCDDGAATGTPITLPASGDATLHFINCDSLNLKDFRVQTLGAGRVRRVGIWCETTSGQSGGNQHTEDINAVGYVTGIHVGGALTYSWGNYLAPTNPTIPTGEIAEGQHDSYSAFNCVECVRVVGGNAEMQTFINFTPTACVKGVRTFNGRGIQMLSGEFGSSSGQVYDFPGQTPNDVIILDAEGADLNSGGPFSLEKIRHEEMGSWARFRAPAAPSTFTSAASMSQYSNVLTVTGAAFNAADHVGSVINVPGAGPAGGWLNAAIISVTNTTTVVLSDAAQTAVTNVTVVVANFQVFNKTISVGITGVDPGSIQPSSVTVSTGAMTAGSDLLTVTGAGLTTQFQGTTVSVPGAGPGGAALVARIRQFLTSTTCRLGIAASTTVSGQTVTFPGITNPVKLVQFMGSGTVAVRNSQSWAANSYISFEKITSAMYCRAEVTNSRFNGTTYEATPTTLVALVNSGTGTTGGLVAETKGNILTSVAGTASGSLTDKTFKVTPTEASNTTWELLSVPPNVTSVSATYQGLYSDKTVLATANTFTVTLPAPIKGYKVRVANIGSGTITVATPSGTISGASSLGAGNVTPTHAEYECVDGTNYVQTA